MIGSITSDERLKPPSILERIGRARWQVKVGYALMDRLKEMIKRHRAEGRDPKPAEDLLATFERSQKVFERDLAKLERRSVDRM
jgi:hypothetical protein